MNLHYHSCSKKTARLKVDEVETESSKFAPALPFVLEEEELLELVADEPSLSLVREEEELLELEVGEVKVDEVVFVFELLWSLSEPDVSSAFPEPRIHL